MEGGCLEGELGVLWPSELFLPPEVSVLSAQVGREIGHRLPGDSAASWRGPEAPGLQAPPHPVSEIVSALDSLLYISNSSLALQAGAPGTPICVALGRPWSAGGGSFSPVLSTPGAPSNL